MLTGRGPEIAGFSTPDHSATLAWLELLRHLCFDEIARCGMGVKRLGIAVTLRVGASERAQFL
ncbi:MAG: hypothetical protein ABSB70_22495 [Candidatus Velthaea sp.]